MANIGTIWIGYHADGAWVKFEHGADESKALAHGSNELGVVRVEREEGTAQESCTAQRAAPEAVTYEESEFFFAAPATEESPIPRQIDSVMVGSDGSRLGRFSGESCAQLAARYRCEIVEMKWEDLINQQESALRTEPKEITQEQWTEALEVLPPMNWGRWLGVESFCMSEFYSGNMTNIYAKCNGRYWSFMDSADIGGEAIARKVAGAALAKVA